MMIVIDPSNKLKSLKVAQKHGCMGDGMWVMLCVMELHGVDDGVRGGEGSGKVKWLI